MMKLNSALLWQHNQAQCLIRLLELKQEWYDKNLDQFWEDWKRDVFNLKTANDFGMSVWEKILDIKLDRTILKTTEQRRFILQMKYFSLTTRCNVLEINEFLKSISSESKQIYLVDDGAKAEGDLKKKMEMTYFFSKALSDPAWQEYIIQQDFLPRPTGVKITFNYFDYIPYGYGDNNSNYSNAKYAISR